VASVAPERRALVRGAAAALALVAVLLALGRVPGLVRAQALADVAARLGPAAALAIPLAYVPWMVLGIPTAPLGVVAGFVLGTVGGGTAATMGCTLGSCGAFLLARGVGRPLVERLAARAPRFDAVRRAVAARGFRLVLLLRLAPVLPLPLLSHTLGLTPVRLRDFVAASLLGVSPSAFAYAAAGAFLRRSGAQPDPSALRLDGAALAAAIAVSLLLGAAAARTLAAELRGDRGGARSS
jgi:uncharacterized membrane protein YdjX (TVP38/TMEM64 family)